MSKNIDLLDYYHDCCVKQKNYIMASQASMMGRKCHRYKVIGANPEQEGWMDLFEIIYGLTIGRARVFSPMRSGYTESPGVIAIFIVLSGQLNVEKSNGAVLYHFESGSVGIGCRSCVDNLLMSYLPDEDHKLEAVSIDVPVGFFAQLFPGQDYDLSAVKSFPHENCLLKMDHLCRHFAIDVADKIMKCNCASMKDIIRIESLVLDLISKVVSHFNQIFQPCYEDRHHNHRHSHRVHQAISILEDQYDMRHTIASLSRLVGLNECYLKALFKEQTGQTIADFQRSIKMKKAKHFIEMSGGSVMEVAHRVGYNNPGHFAAAFRKEYGLSPSAFKQARMLVC